MDYKIKSRCMGDPLDNMTEVGPLARSDLRNELHQQVKESINMNAKCLLGGFIPEGNNTFYPLSLIFPKKTPR